MLLLVRKCGYLTCNMEEYIDIYLSTLKHFTNGVVETMIF
jgi:hypothetical protein